MLLTAIACIGGPVTAQQGSPEGPPPAPTPVAAEVLAEARAQDSERDALVEERLKAIFARVAELAEVEVEVRAGVVRLSGETTSSVDRAKAEKLAQSIEGVVYVDNDVEETRDVVKRLLPSWDAMLGHVRKLIYGVPLFLVALLVFGAAWFLGRAARRLPLNFAGLADKSLLRELLRQVLRTVIVVFGAFVALEILDATALAGAILGTAGVVGLAVSFAFRDIIENYLASVLLSLRNPFRPQDLVEIDGQLGKVLRLTTSETVLMSLDGNHIRIPNATVFKQRIVNFTRNPMRRFDFAVGVGVDEDLVRAQQLGLDALSDLSGVVSDPKASCLVEDLADSTVNLRFFGWVDQRQSDYAKVKSQAIRLVKTILDAHGVDMPMPTYEVRLRRPAVSPDSADSSAEAKQALLSARTADTSVDTDLDRQIEQEKAETSEEDLLKDQPASPPSGAFPSA